MSPVGLPVTESVFDQPFPDTLAYTDMSLPWVSQCVYVIVSGTDVRFRSAKGGKESTKQNGLDGWDRQMGRSPR